MGSIFEAADHKQKDILPESLHFDLINIWCPANEEASHILEDIQKYDPENLYDLLHTILEGAQLFFITAVLSFDFACLQLRNIWGWNFKLAM